MIYPNLFYFNTISEIGGIETWFYYLSVLYKDVDITVMYQRGDARQIRRIKRRFRCIKWDGKEPIECENLFVNFNREILDYATVHNKTYLVIHGDYLDMVNRGQLKKNLLPIDERIDEYIGISQTVCDNWYKLTGIKANLSYNPVVKYPPLKQIKLISAQRLSAEKGRKRIEKLIDCLDKYCNTFDVDYIYDIYTNNYGAKLLSNLRMNKHINIKESRLDINRLLGEYDYTVVLSDNEGYCYTVVESLLSGTPCIVTPVPVFKEIGLNTNNSITLEFDCSNIEYVVKKMFNKKFDFKYDAKKDSYKKFLIDKPNTYIFEKEEDMAKIKALMNYDDTYEGKAIKKGDVYETTDERARLITSSTHTSKVTGASLKYAEYTDETINVGWQEPKKQGEPVIESVEQPSEEIENIIEEPKKEAKKTRKKKGSKTE